MITGILLGAIISRRIAGRMDLTRQVRLGLTITFAAVGGARDPASHSSIRFRSPLQQALLFFTAIGAQFAFPVLTLRMLDLFPAARGTAASAQSFVALLITAFTLGVIAPKVLPHLEWIAWTSLALTSLASICWYLSLRAPQGRARRSIRITAHECRRESHRGIAVAIAPQLRTQSRGRKAGDTPQFARGVRLVRKPLVGCELAQGGVARRARVTSPAIA